MPLHRYDWILALITIAFCASSFGNGANDVANSYATSVAARTLTMAQAGGLAVITEFVGAVALGSRVTDTIRSGIMDLDHFTDTPATLMLAMACAEFGSATWLLIATKFGFPVSTTQTIVGAIVGVGYASQANVKWEWDDGSISQIAASWAVSPLLAACFGAIIFGVLKHSVLERQDPFKWAMRLIPVYIAFTCAILALFIVVEAPTAPDLEEFGAGKAAGIILAVFFGMLILSLVFFMPYLKRRLVKEDTRVKFYHVPLGPLLLKDNPPLYFPSTSDHTVVDHYENSYKKAAELESNDSRPDSGDGEPEKSGDVKKNGVKVNTAERERVYKSILTPEERFLASTKDLPAWKPSRLWALTKYFFLRGVTIDCVSHTSDALDKVHDRARRYDLKVEHMWTYVQVLSALLMSIAHGSNDVANAVAPWASAYQVWREGIVSDDSDTPVWILVVAGFLLGAGFWFFGHHIVRALGNRLTQLSPTRGYAMELGAAITVLLASRLALPVSTTQCVTGALVGVALMNYDINAVHWIQVAKIFSGWILTLPIAGLIAGLLMLMALNTPHF
ncbi:MAG: hypothetical protein M1831_004162 [Alyxoria varia]|nr:MAG: hypothetical protein M1831_004162 [Alyxoria varia]